MASLRTALPAALVLLGGLTGCTGSSAPTAAPPAPSPAAPSPSVATAPTSAPSPSPSASGRVIRVPAAETQFLLSPSGNIVCGLSDRGADCEIGEHSFTPPPKPADCEFDWGGEVGVAPGAGPAEFGCVSDTMSGAEPSRTLAYGDTLDNGVVRCTSERTGTSCRTADGAHGFTLSRTAYRLF